MQKIIVACLFGGFVLLVFVAPVIAELSVSKIPVLFQDRTATEKCDSQKSLDNFVEHEKLKVAEAMDRINSASGEHIADYHMIASSEFANNEDKELVHERLAVLLKSSDKEIVRASIASLSFYVSEKVMRELISLGTSSKEFYPDVVKALSFNPYENEKGDYRRTRKKDNLKELVEDKNASEIQKRLVEDALTEMH